MTVQETIMTVDTYNNISTMIPKNNGTYRTQGARRTGSQTITINDKQWYFTMVEKRNPDGTVKAGRPLMADYTIDQIKNHVIICYTPGVLPGQTRRFLNQKGQDGRLYAFFQNYIEVMDYVNKMPTKFRCFYEVILGSCRQKPRFDLDVNVADFIKEYPGVDIDVAMNALIDAVVDSCREIITSQGLKFDIERDLLLYSSHGDDKGSYHIVINNWYHNNNEEARAFYRAVETRVSALTAGKYMKYLDDSIYSSLQQFRLVGSTKYGKNRFKFYHESFVHHGVQYQHKYLEDVSEPEVKMVTVMCESLVTFCSGCQHIPSMIVRPSQISDSVATIDDIDVDNYIRMLDAAYPQHPFVYRDVSNGYINMARIEPSHCPVCKQYHEMENSIIYKRSDRVYWKCRRANKHAAGQKLLIGIIALSYNDMLKMVEDQTAKVSCYNNYVPAGTAGSQTAIHGASEFSDYIVDTVDENCGFMGLHRSATLPTEPRTEFHDRSLSVNTSVVAGETLTKPSISVIVGETVTEPSTSVVVEGMRDITTNSNSLGLDVNEIEEAKEGELYYDNSKIPPPSYRLDSMTHMFEQLAQISRAKTIQDPIYTLSRNANWEPVDHRRVH